MWWPLLLLYWELVELFELAVFEVNVDGALFRDVGLAAERGLRLILHLLDQDGRHLLGVVGAPRNLHEAMPHILPAPLNPHHLKERHASCLRGRKFTQEFISLSQSLFMQQRFVVIQVANEIVDQCDIKLEPVEGSFLVQSVAVQLHESRLNPAHLLG